MTSSAKPAATSGGWRAVRVTFLLLVLALVAIDAWLTHKRTTDWKYPLRVSIYPLSADNRPATRRYLTELDAAAFQPIEEMFQREAHAYHVPLDPPVQITLRPALDVLPPARDAGAGLAGTAWWSLQLRWWANRREAGMPAPRSQVRIFVLYCDPEKQPRVPHSLGLQKGLIGVVYAFASRAMAPTNNVVIAHELLHTLGATDKYDPASGLPIYPDGYAQPQREPRYPQVQAELMAGRIPLDAGNAEIPRSLDAVIVGPATAREIGWVKP